MKKPSFLLILIFLSVLLNSTWEAILPFFQGPDESTHFGTIQHRAEPKEKDWAIDYGTHQTDGTNITRYNFSEEVSNTAQSLWFDQVKMQPENTPVFTGSFLGLNEHYIHENEWKKYIDKSPHGASSTTSLYYALGALIESSLEKFLVLDRFLALRIFSGILATLVGLLAYFSFAKLGYPRFFALLFALLVVFQPMLAMIGTNVNIDIMLILAFSFFVYSSFILLKEGLKTSSALLVLASLILAFFSKGPGVVLVIFSFPFLGYLTYKQFPLARKKILGILLSSLFLGGTVLCLFAPAYIESLTRFGEQSQFNNLFTSLGEYLSSSADLDALQRTHASYWGHFGWLDTKLSEAILDIIWTIEIISFLGLVLYLFTHRSSSFLPQKKYVLFCIAIILALQLAIRFYDWRVFDNTGKILIGTPGRYFLPNIIPHMLLLVTGLGYLFTKNERQFGILLKILAVFMILLSLYSLINVIIPRYYL